jgi:hypothetical protein
MLSTGSTSCWLWSKGDHAKTSATSRASRPMVALHGVQFLEQTDYLAQDVDGDLGVQGGRLQALLTEQDLDQMDVDLLFQQVGATPDNDGSTMPLSSAPGSDGCIPSIRGS